MRVTDTTPAPTSIRSASLLKHALAYAKRGWHVFPCYEVSLPTGACACGNPRCGNPGKHPRIAGGFKAATTDEAQIREWWRKWPLANLAIATGASRLAVVDVDPRNHGDETIAQLQQQHAQLPETPRAATGGMGEHHVFSWPTDREIRGGVLGLGVDLKADGGYIIAPPSAHYSGRSYSWDAGAHPSDIPAHEVPKWVANLVGSKRTRQYESSGGVTDGFLGAAFDELGWLGRDLGPGKAAAYCPWEGEHTGGARFDSSTVIFAPTKGYRVGWFWCSHSHCQHKRTMADVLAMLPQDAKQRATARLKLDPQYDPSTEEKQRLEVRQFDPNSSSEDWVKSLRRNQEGGITKDAGNASLLLANLPEWRGCLEYDGFADRVRWARPCPEMPGFAPPRPGSDLADHHVLYARQWLAKFRGISFSKTDIQDALESAAKLNHIHPVRSYLDSLVWDRKPRAATWLSTYLGAASDEYTHAVGRWWLISAIARIYQPGCQADHLVVLEGDQGSGKSTAVRALGGDWFLANLPDITNKDAAAVLQGHWITEIGELDAFRGAAGTRVKDWVTRTVDSFRPAYGRFTVRRPRSCVFIGTTNEAHYLTDATGARRFWPVQVGSVDRERLTLDRDQLWAEARCYFEAGEPWWPSAELAPLLREQQEERFVIDEWERRIATWVVANDGFTVGDVLGAALSLEPSKWDKPLQSRVGICLRRLGYVVRQKREDGARVRRYWKTG